MISWFGKLTPNQKKIWITGSSVVLMGAAFKYLYFNFSRGLVVGGMERNHLDAKKNLSEAREFAQWSQKDRSNRTPPLTKEQRRQLQAYLDLMAETHFGEGPSSEK